MLLLSKFILVDKDYEGHGCRQLVGLENVGGAQSSSSSSSALVVLPLVITARELVKALMHQW